MYEINAMFADFTEKELAKGSELFAMGLSELIFSAPEKSRDKYDRDSRLISIRASVRDDQSDRMAFSPEICLDEEHGELVSTFCDCRAFKQNLYACPHITAAILSYLEERDGRERIANSPLSELLEKKTGIERPFRPGILRKTEPFLLDFLMDRREAELSMMQYGGKKPGSLRAVCILQEFGSESQQYVELKIGEKRLYIVKNLPETLKSYEDRREVSFGKNLNVTLSPEAFDDDSRRTMDFFLRILQEARMVRHGNHFAVTQNSEARYAILYGDRLDQFMEEIAAGGIFYGDEKHPCRFLGEEKQLPVIVEKQEFGAKIRVEESRVIANSIDWMYLMNGRDIYRIPAGGKENFGLVLSGLMKHPELYVSERDLPALCRDLLPVLDKTARLQLKGLDPKTYLPPKPLFEMYLDYPQEGLVSCQAYALYRSRTPAGKETPGEEVFAEILDEEGNVISVDARVTEKGTWTPRGQENAGTSAPDSVSAEPEMTQTAQGDPAESETADTRKTEDAGQEAAAETSAADGESVREPDAEPVRMAGGGRARGKRFLLYEQNHLEENRDFAAERIAGEAIRSHFKAFDEETSTLFFDGDEAQIYEFLTERLPSLEKIGTVFVSDNMKKLQVKPLSTASVGVSLSGGLLEMSVHSDVFTNDELAEILSSYHRKKRYHRLKSGMFVSFGKGQEEAWSAISEAMRYAGKDKSSIRIPMFRAMYLDDMLREKDGIAYSKSRDYRALLKSMKSVEDADFEIPAFLEPILRNYQKEGFYWLKTLKANGFGGILADDMGLGKTLQVLAFLLSEKEEGRSGDALRTLIITPASLVYNWKKEISQYTPQLVSAVITGTVPERKAKIAEALKEDADVWITSYDLLKRDVELYENIVFANEVVDEAQYIKNQMTIASKSVRLVNSSFRTALTGTPIENKLSELWSIFDYLMPGFLYEYSRFRSELELPIVSAQDEEAMDKIRKMVHPFVLRRLKKDVLKELPDKTEEAVSVELTGEQRRLYEAHEERLRLFLEDQSEAEFTQNRIAILAELTKLRQLCCGPELLFENYSGPNSKLETCMELVNQALEGGHKLLVFSQFTSMLDIICERLAAEKIDYYRIDGSVKKEDRMRMVDAFQQEGNPVMVFCISLKAGGTGLNLTAADIVIHYDPWWNLAAQNQATDRVHRIGQTNPVTVYQLIAERTIEERIRDLQESKYQLAEEVLSGGEIGSIRVNRDEIMQLLSENREKESR